MSAQAKAKTKAKSKKTKSSPANIVWFDIPADDMSRAKTFYSKLFGWNINPFPQMEDYCHIDTAGPDASPDGGLMKRKHPDHTFTAYVSVDSVSKASAKIEKLGGQVCMAKTAVPGMGYFAICQDTENNTFAIWERNEKAK